MKQKILAAYEALADHYDAMIDTKPHNAFYERPNTLRLVGDVDRKAVLDAACGPGKYAEILLAQGAAVTGFDLSPRMVELAKKRNPEAGHFFVHDLSEPLTLCGDASFDLVLCSLAIHYIEDWNPVIREFHRVLKPEGKLVLSMEHPFFDYTYYQSQNYFQIEAVHADWKGFGKTVTMHEYRRPLEACIQPLTENGFYLDKLVEPRPMPEFEKHDPKHFAELNAFPAFLCMRGVKK